MTQYQLPYEQGDERGVRVVYGIEKCAFDLADDEAAPSLMQLRSTAKAPAFKIMAHS